ncbi:hypothetical protein F52700_4511 [Fusarium sp. NRRL 52700]|nr:hypothetical protein F52700_4511 [Fusarium sp. NRRL 52700]
MAPQPFLSLPFELRHMIYKYYFTTEQGYYFNAASCKLTTAYGGPIDFALIYTCRLVAEETKEMPFLHNDISFKTFYQQDLSSWLCRFDRLINAQFRQQLQLLTELRPFITPEIQHRIKEKFPWFTIRPLNALFYHSTSPWRGWMYGLLQELNSPSLAAVTRPPHNDMYIDICSNDRAYSAQRAAIKFTLRLLCESSDERFIAKVNQTLVGWEYSGGARLSNFLDRCYEPWRFPSSLSDLDEMGSRRYGDGEGWTSITSWKTSILHRMQYRQLYRSSAVSAALKFLDALPINKRSSLRNIIIHEDGVSVGYPDGHAIGLISFCQENRRLRIRHKFSMVKNLFERAYFSQGYNFDYIQAEKDEDMLRLASMNLHRIVGNCLAEAMYLPEAGMPDGSYILLLDAEDATDMCSAIFRREVLDREARLMVLNRALREDPNIDWAGTYSHVIGLTPKAYSAALKHLFNKTSFLESNFYPGHLGRVDTLMAHYKEVGLEHCAAALSDSATALDYDLESFSHVPKFRSVLMENLECRELSPVYNPAFPDLDRFYSQLLFSQYSDV